MRVTKISFNVKRNVLFTIMFFFSLSLGFSKLYSQTICNSSITKKYVRYSELVSGTAKLNNVTVHSVAVVKSGIWLTGLCTDASNSDVNFFVAKLNDTGKVTLFKMLGTSSAEGGYNIPIAATSAGGCVIAGTTYETSIASSVGVVVYINPNGTVKWSKKTPTNGNSGQYDVFRQVHVDSKTGNILAVGSGYQYNNSPSLLYGMLDSNGTQLFLKNRSITITGNNVQVHAHGISKSPNGYWISGWCNNTYSPFLVNIEDDGDVLNSYVYTNNRNNTFDRVIFTNSGKLYVSGFTNRNGTNDGLLACITASTGNIVWQRNIPTTFTGVDVSNHLHLEGKNLYLSLQSNGFGGGGNRNGLIVVDTAGTYQFARSLYIGTTRFTSAHKGQDFDILKTGGMVMVGADNSTGVHINAIINSPCSSTDCANHSTTITMANMNLTRNAGAGSTNNNGTFVSVNNTETSINFTDAIECYQACQQPKKMIIDSLLLCSGGSVKANVRQTTPATYLWNDGDTSSIRSFNAVSSNILTTTNACASRKDTIFVINGAAPRSPLFRDTTFCVTGWTYTLDVTQNACTYIWDNASTKSVRIFTFPGTYWLQTNNACGSRIDTIKMLQGISAIKPNLLDTSLCPGELYINNFNTQARHSYEWQDGDTNLLRTFGTPGMKILAVRTQCETVYDSMIIKSVFKPNPPPFLKDTTFCSTPIFYTTDATSPTPNCSYFWGDGNSNPQRTFNYAGKWYLSITNRCGSRIDSLLIGKDTLPVKVLKDNEYFCLGETLKVKAPQPNCTSCTYDWSNGDNKPETIFQNSQYVTLVTTNDCGSRTDYSNVYIIRCDCDFYTPSSFTPNNGDNINDKWLPYFDCAVKSGTYSIYNRWGECVKKDVPYNEGWDGTIDGDEVTDGLYIFEIKGVYDLSIKGTRTFSRSGTIMLTTGKKK